MSVSAPSPQALCPPEAPPTRAPEDANRLVAESLIRGLLRAGVRTAILSPGSRSTPLVLALDRAAAREELELHVLLDERAAAFVALGNARRSGRPVVLLATSGSAGAHWLPAIVEADASGLPLVALTANRPAELQGAGAPQTVSQRELFSPYVRLAAQIPASGDVHDLEPAWLQTLALRAVQASLGLPSGPVHLDVAFRKPLWEPSETAAAARRAGRRPTMIQGRPTLDSRVLDDLAEELRSTTRGLVVLGPPSEGREVIPGRCGAAAKALSQRLGWPLLVDGASAHAGLGLPHADLLARDPTLREALRPEQVLRIGRVPTSAPLRRWLAMPPTRTLLVDPGGRWHDPDHRADHWLIAEPDRLLDALAARLQGALPRAAERSRWRAAWHRSTEAAEGALDADEVEPWGGAIARLVLEALPEGGTLHVASSLAIRDVDAFAAPRADVLLTSSRGANGIDGTLATALGQALAAPDAASWVLLGDLAFLHDAGALVAARALEIPLTAIVVDDHGGSIFEELPIAQHPAAFSPLFLTPQPVAIPPLCLGAGVPCVEVDSLGASRAALACPPGPGLRVVHVAVDRARARASRAQARERAAAAAREELGL